MGSGAERIRLRYSSFINYAGLMYRALIAIGFVIVVARKLSPQEFGLWGIILSSTLMLASLSYVWLFWVQRYLGRGFKEAFGSGLLMTAAYSLVGLVAYVGLAYIEYLTLGWGFNYLLAGSAIFVLNVFDSLINVSLSVTKPEGIGYKRITYETARFVIAYSLVVYAGMRLYGAIWGVSGALFLNLLYGAYLLVRTNEISLNFSADLIREWLRGSFIPGLNVLQSFLTSGYRVFLSWVTGSDLPVAYLNVGLSSQTPLLSASYATSPALYARTLREVRGSDLTEVLRIYFLFSGFIATTFIVLAVPITTLYNPAYLGAYKILSLITLYALILGFLNLYLTALLGYEKVDLDKGMRIRALLSSYLMKVPVLRLAIIVIAYSITSLAMLPSIRSSSLNSAELSAFGLLLGVMSVAPYVIIRTRKVIPHKIPSKEAIISTLGSVVLALMYYSLGLNHLVVKSVWRDGMVLGFWVLFGAIIYVIPWLIGSRWFREILNRGLRKFIK